MAHSQLIRIDISFRRSLDNMREALRQEGHKGSYTEATALLNFKQGIDRLDREAVRELLAFRKMLFNGKCTNEGYGRNGGQVETTNKIPSQRAKPTVAVPRRKGRGRAPP